MPELNPEIFVGREKIRVWFKKQDERDPSFQDAGAASPYASYIASCIDRLYDEIEAGADIRILHNAAKLGLNEMFSLAEPKGLESWMQELSTEDRLRYKEYLARDSILGAAINLPRLVTPMVGTIEQVLVKEGQDVETGQGIVTFNAMRMTHRLGAEIGGRVLSLHVRNDEAVEAGALIAVIN